MGVFRGNVWRAPCALLLAALPLGAGCATQSDNNTLRDSRSQGRGETPASPEAGNPGSAGSNGNTMPPGP